MMNWDDLEDLLDEAEPSPPRGRDLAAPDLDRAAPDRLPEPQIRLETPKSLQRSTPPPRAIASEESSASDSPATPLADFARFPFIPGYELLEKMGAGGMGVVYKARDLVLKRLVAIKMILSVGRGAQPEQQNRFRVEAEALARLHHPHIVQIYSYGEHRGIPYFVMEHVEGGNLEQCLRTRPPSIRDSASLILLLAKAVQAAHQKGIIHRDLKPNNVLLRRQAEEANPKAEAVNLPASNFDFQVADLEPVIADFGLAKMLGEGNTPDSGQTAAGMVLGTPAYMAPEQAEGHAGAIGPATDVYALGVMLYRMLAGKVPFHGISTAETLRRVMLDKPVPPRRLNRDVPRALEAICLKCLHKDPARRYPTAAALVEDLQQYLEQPTTTAARQVGTPWQWGIAAAAILLVMLLFWRPWDGTSPTANNPNATDAADGAKGNKDQQTEPAGGATGNKTTPSTAYKGFVDLLVTERGNPKRQLVWLYDPAARPLKKGFELRLEAQIDREAFLYVLWLDTKGTLHPVYPWAEDDWNQRPAAEKKTNHLSLPEDVGRSWEVDPGPAGMEMLVLLARDTPLPTDVDLAQLLGQFQPMPLHDPNDVVWFENGQILRDDPKRAPNFKQTTATHNLTLQTQAKLWQNLEKHFPYMNAVAFANLGG